jgi:hypothetical protein
VISGCSQNEIKVNEFRLPTRVFIDNSCFLSDQGIWVHFKGQKCDASYFYLFTYMCYPMIDSVGNEISSSEAFWGNMNQAGSIAIPANYLSAFSRFSMRVKMDCDGQMGEVTAEFALNEKDSNCKVWEVASFSNPN